MTQNKRIVLNIVATYGRSLYAFAHGLISARSVTILSFVGSRLMRKGK